MEEKYFYAKSAETFLHPFLYAEEKDAVFVVGKDATPYLQGQLTKDVTKIAPGQTAEAFLLEPKGEISCFVSVKKADENRFLLTTEKGFGSVLLQRLEKFKIRIKADLVRERALSLLVFYADSDRDLPLLCDAHAVYMNNRLAVLAESTKYGSFPGLSDVKDYVGKSSLWRDLSVREILVPGFGGDAFPGFAGEKSLKAVGDFATKHRFIGENEYNFLRICHGIPKMGFEIKDKVLPPALGITDAVIDYDKGCYTGQELVARLDARGNNIPVSLKVLVLDKTGMPGGSVSGPKFHTGAPVFVGDKPAGTLSSVAHFENSEVGLGFIKREFLNESSVLLAPAAGDLLGTGNLKAGIYDAPVSPFPEGIFGS